MKKLLIIFLCFFVSLQSFAQLKWTNVDSLFQPLPRSVHVYFSNSDIDGKANIAYYVEADLKDKKLNFTSDTTLNRRLTPAQFFEKNSRPLVVVNTTFFEFATNRNLNVVIKEKQLVSHNAITARSSSDTSKKIKQFSSAIGISKRRKPDVAWIRTDSTKRYAYAVQLPYTPEGKFFAKGNGNGASINNVSSWIPFKKWKMQTAVGGGPVLIQDGKVKITNNEEKRFGGKAIDDKHPRTAMGYTNDRKLIVMVVQGRMPGIAEGASLKHLAEMLQQIGCNEALNLDGGGSSTLLINGKETIKPSDKEGQRPVPAVFLIQHKN